LGKEIEFGEVLEVTFVGPVADEAKFVAVLEPVSKPNPLLLSNHLTVPRSISSPGRDAWGMPMWIGLRNLASLALGFGQGDAMRRDGTPME
jgi:hypothetical protein